MAQRTIAEYRRSWAIRGDNTPEIAKYLGYLTTRELYPDFKFIAYEDYLKELLEGKAIGVYKRHGPPQMSPNTT
jgi:hypothetical protein